MEWFPGWEATRRHLRGWWERKDLVLRLPTFPRATPHEAVEDPGPPPEGENFHTAPEWRARRNHRWLAEQDFLADTFPVAGVDIGPGSLALLLGSKPGFSPTTVWFHPTMEEDDDPEERPPFRFDPENRWWRIHEASLRASAELARGKYLVGCPDLVENVDILAALRDPQVLMMDMIERPEWIEEKMWELNEVWFEAYGRVYDIIKQPDGGACWAAFALWGPGRTAKVQCDASAMFSPAMFARFVVPALKAQCAWLDFSMFHLDGHQCIPHLDHLLAIEELDAIEWTPDPTVPGGGSPEWYPMYKRILAAGKSVQIVNISVDEVIPLLDAVGGAGLYIMAGGGDRDACEKLCEKAEAYRPKG